MARLTSCRSSVRPTKVNGFVHRDADVRINLGLSYAMQPFLPDEVLTSAVQIACYACAAITAIVSFLFALRF